MIKKFSSNSNGLIFFTMMSILFSFSVLSRNPIKSLESFSRFQSNTRSSFLFSRSHAELDAITILLSAIEKEEAR